jgi:hypothetical protein
MAASFGGNGFGKHFISIQQQVQEKYYKSGILIADLGA